MSMYLSKKSEDDDRHLTFYFDFNGLIEITMELYLAYYFEDSTLDLSKDYCVEINYYQFYANSNRKSFSKENKTNYYYEHKRSYAFNDEENNEFEDLEFRKNIHKYIDDIIINDETKNEIRKEVEQIMDMYFTKDKIKGSLFKKVGV